MISIITPTYNHSKYISECIESVLAQSFKNWEMIIVNDGSTDNTIEIVEDYIKKDKRIKLVNQENKGIFKLSETYNKALNESKGEFIAILEGDDIWEKDKLEKQIKIFENNPNVVLSCGKELVKNENLSVVLGTSPEIINTESFKYNKPVGSFLNYLLYENPIVALTICVRKTILQKMGGFYQDFEIPTVDISTLLRLSLCGEFYYIDDILGTWRNSATQITKIFPVELARKRKELVFSFYETLPFEIKNSLNIDLKKLELYYLNILQVSYARSGRYKLIRKDFKGARKDYFKAIFFKGFRNNIWRLRSIIGIIFSLFKSDVENFSKFLGKKSYVK